MDPMEGCSYHFEDSGCKVSEEELPTEDLPVCGLGRRSVPCDSPISKFIQCVLVLDSLENWVCSFCAQSCVWFGGS